MEAQVLEAIFNQNTVFFGLFLYLFWTQQQEKKDQNVFLVKQQDILSNIAGSVEKLADRIERIEIDVEKLNERGDK